MGVMKNADSNTADAAAAILSILEAQPAGRGQTVRAIRYLLKAECSIVLSERAVNQIVRAFVASDDLIERKGGRSDRTMYVHPQD